MDQGALTSFIVKAKAATYVGDGRREAPSRPGAHDLLFSEGEWAYHDSYFGGRDFIGEEVVYQGGIPVWAMNYHGRILLPDWITPAEAGETIKASLSRMYRENRFLGGFENQHGGFLYRDANEGDVESFQGRETISRQGLTVYELVYHGGLITDG